MGDENEYYRYSNQVTWRYQSTVFTNFAGYLISGQQRLPNGNTVVDSGPHGHFFEVTPEGEVVWEYINPYTSSLGLVKQLNDDNTTVAAYSGMDANNVFRC